MTQVFDSYVVVFILVSDEFANVITTILLLRYLLPPPEVPEHQTQ